MDWLALTSRASATARLEIDMEIVIEGNEIKCEADLHKMLRERLDFGPHYGNNLAAMRDRLSSDVERPVTLIWMNSDSSREALGNDLFDRVVAVFRFVEEQDKMFGWDERFTFVVK
jgi:ribonuclease inhibitor